MVLPGEAMELAVGRWRLAGTTATEACNAEPRQKTRQCIIVMQGIRYTPRKINEAAALSLSLSRHFVLININLGVCVYIYISFYLLMDFILFMKVDFHA